MKVNQIFIIFLWRAIKGQADEEFKAFMNLIIRKSMENWLNNLFVNRWRLGLFEKYPKIFTQNKDLKKK